MNIFKLGILNANIGSCNKVILQVVKTLLPVLLLTTLTKTGHTQITYSLDPGSHINTNGTFGPTNGYTSIITGNGAATSPYSGDLLGNAALQLYSNTGAATTVAYRTFSQASTGGTARTLNPGDRFLIKFQTNTAANGGTKWPATGGSIGISFNNNTTYSTTANRTTNQVCKFELGAVGVNGGNWSVYSGAGLATINTNPNTTPNSTGNTFANAGTARWLQIDVTSSNTFDATIYSLYTGSGTGGTYQKYCNLSFGSAGPISSFCVYDIGVAGGNNPDIWVEQLTLSGIDQTSVIAQAQPDVSAITFENIVGASSAAATISGNITNGSNATTNATVATPVTMGGTSSITLTSAANAYTGTTTLSSGTLILGVANAIPNTTPSLILNGGTLSSGAAAGFSDIMSSVTLQLTANSTIALGTGAHAIKFANSSAVSWTAGKALTVTGWTGTPGASGTAGQLFVGTTNAGLIAGQLAQISFAGFSGAIQLSTGEIVPTGILTPVIVLADNSGGQVIAGNISANSTNNIIYNFQTTVSVTGATLNAVAFSTTGTAVGVTDITNLKLWYSTTNSFASAAAISTLGAALGAGTHSFTGLTQSVAVGIGYFWVTADIPSGATVNNTITGTALAPANLTFASGTPTGSTSGGGTKTIVAAVPTIVLANNSGGQVAAGNISANSNNNIIYNFQTTVSNAAATLNTVAFSTTGTVVSGTDITNLKLWYSASNSFGAATPISTLNTTLGTGVHSFNGLTQSIPVGTGYFWITADIPSGATVNNTITGTALTPANLTFASGIPAGSAFAGGTQTIKALYFQSATTGNWSNIATWNSSFAIGGPFTAAASYPVSGANLITILNTHTVTLDVSPGNLANGVTINNGGTLVLNSGTTLAISANTITVNGTLNVQTGSVVSGAGNFSLPNTSCSPNTLKIGDPNGITTSPTLSGSIQVTGTRSFGNSSYEYNCSASGTPQFTGNGLPATINNLTINRSAISDIVALTTSNTTIAFNSCGGYLTLNSGIFKIGSGNTLIIIGSGSGINNPNATGTSNFASSGINGIDGGTLSCTTSGGGFFTLNGPGATTFYNLNFANNVVFNFGSSTPSFTVNGTFTIPNNNWTWGSNLSNANAPIYGVASTLYYNRGGQQYSPSYEWSASSGTINSTPGYPNNVTLVNVGAQPLNPNITGNYTIAGIFSAGDGVIAGTIDLSGLTSFTCNGVIINNSSSLKAPSVELNVKGNWLRTGATIGTFIHNGSTVNFSGSGTSVSPQTITILSGTETQFNNVIISNGTYVKLNSPVTLSTGPVLYLTSGILETSSSNLLYITNTNVTGITGSGSATTYINGPVKWDIAFASKYTFPLGKGATYLPFDLKPGAAATNTVTAEAFNSNSAGSPDGITVTSISNTEYWSLSSTSSFASGANVSAGRSSGAGTFNMLAKSTAAAGIYSAIGGIAGTVGSITGFVNAGSIGTASPWFVVLAYGPLSIVTVSVTHPAVCLGVTVGSVTVSGSGGVPPYSYDLDGANTFSNTTGIFTNLVAGTHTFTVKDAATPIPATKSVTITLQQLTVTADTSICTGGSVQLLASGAGTTYSWSPAAGLSSTTIANPVATPAATTTYTVTANIISTTNLITNPGFELGGTINSDYTRHLGAPMFSSITVYGNPHNGIFKIAKVGTDLINSFLTFPPHSGDSMMVVDGPLGSGYENQRIWYQTVTGLTATKQYIFSYWISNVSGSSMSLPKIRTNIAGTDVGNYTIPSSGWTQVSYTFTATGTSAVINLYDSTNADVGNDFALDELAVYQTCTDSKNVTITISPNQKTWLGTISNDWNTAGNWCGGIPSSTDTVIIPVVNTNYPLIATATNGTAKELTIFSGASLTITGTGYLDMKGNFTNNGSLMNWGEIKLTGSVVQTFPGATGTIVAMTRLTIANTSGLNPAVTINKDLLIREAITPTQGIVNLNNSYITIRSVFDSTARVGVVGASASFTYTGTGNFAVERYYPARRSWRLVTVPLSGTGTIFDNWQLSGAAYGAGNIGLGTLVSGPGATSPIGVNGLDSSFQQKSSLKAGVNLTPVLNTKVPLSTNLGSADNIGYFLFVRGDRDFNNTIIPNTNNTTLSAKGKLQTGIQTFAANATAGGATLIGNPYASPVSFKTISRNNVINRFYAWDPKLAGSSGQGGYVVVDDFLNTGSYTKVPPSPGGQDSIIQSSQAIFVFTNLAGAASVIFNESDKATKNNLGVFRPSFSIKTRLQSFRTNLYLLNADKSTSLSDGNLVQFNDRFSAEIDNMDAPKFSNINETIGLMRKGSLLSIERRPVINTADTLFFKISRFRKGNYRFEFIADKLDGVNLAGFLEDNFLHNRTPLNMNNSTMVDFSVTADALSFAADRFRVVFRQSVNYTYIRAHALNNNIAVEWQMGTDLNINRYEIERSVDSISFKKVGIRLSSGTNIEAGYSWLDEGPSPGEYYYRIRKISNNGATVYSREVKVLINKGIPAVYIFPNPVVGNEINLQINNMPAGIYTARLLNGMGQVMLVKKFNHAAGSNPEIIRHETVIAKAVYNMEITGPGNYLANCKVVY